PQPVKQTNPQDDGGVCCAGDDEPCLLLRYTGLMPAYFTTLPHFSASSATNLAKSSAAMNIGSMPRPTRRAFMFSSESTVSISRSSFATTAAGVPLGAPRPYQLLASKPGTDSPIAGTSGSACARVAVVTPSTRKLPSRICVIDERIVTKVACTSPLSRSG